MGRLDRQLLWRLATPFSLILFLAGLQKTGLDPGGQAGSALGLRPPVYDQGAVLLLIGLAAGQAPAIWLWRRLGTSALLSLALAIGGLHAAIASLSPSAEPYWLLRFMQGLFQAGMGPAVVLTLAEIAPQRSWGRMIALPLAAGFLGVAASPIVWSALAPFAPPTLAGWRWPMLAVGVLTAAVGIFASLTAWPGRGPDPVQVEVLRKTREGEALNWPRASLITAASTDLRTFLWAAAALALSLGAGGIGLMAMMLRGLSGGGMPGWTLWVSLAAGLLLSGVSSDRLGRRYWHVGLFALVASATLFAAVMPGEPAKVRVGLLLVSALAMGGAIGSYWPIALRRLTPSARPVGMAIIAAASAIGSALAQPLIAWSRIGDGNLILPMLLLANMLFLAAAMMLCAASFDMRFDLRGPRAGRGEGR